MQLNANGRRAWTAFRYAPIAASRSLGVHTGGPAVTQRLLLQRLPGKVEPLAVQVVALTVRVAMPGGKGKPVEQVKLRPG
jgi:hypothetical protein